MAHDLGQVPWPLWVAVSPLQRKGKTVGCRCGDLIRGCTWTRGLAPGAPSVFTTWLLLGGPYDVVPVPLRDQQGGDASGHSWAQNVVGLPAPSHGPMKPV